MLLLLLGQETPSGTDPVSLFISYGIPGLVLASIILGWLWAKPAVDTIIKRAERAESQRDDLLKVYEEKIIPALTETAQVNREMKPVLLEVVRVLEQVKNQPVRRQAGGS